MSLAPVHDPIADLPRASRLAPKTRSWTAGRSARFGFLMGLGWNAERIAKDSGIVSTPANVHVHARRLGLSFCTARAWSLDLPLEAHARFGQAADKRGLTRHALARLLLREIATDPHLIDNVLDDADEVAA